MGSQDLLPTDGVIAEKIAEILTGSKNGEDEATEYLRTLSSMTLLRVGTRLGMPNKVLKAIGGKEAIIRALIHMVIEDMSDVPSFKEDTNKVPILKSLSETRGYIKKVVNSGIGKGIARSVKGSPGAYTMAIILEVTPAIAVSMLRRRRTQRPISKPFVEVICREINDSRFVPIGDPIRLGPDGELVDAQHRLCAVIKTDKSVYWIPLVIVPVGNWIEHIDSQIHKRSTNDIRAIMGQGKLDTRIISAIIQEEHDFKHIQTGDSQKNNMVNSSKYLELAVQLLDLAKEKHGTRGATLPTSGYIAGAIRCARVTGDIDDVLAFFGAAFRSEEEVNGEPAPSAKLLWQAITSNRGRGGGGQPAVSKCAAQSIQCWNDWRRGNNPKSILMRYRNRSVDPETGKPIRGTGSPTIPEPS